MKLWKIQTNLILGMLTCALFLLGNLAQAGSTIADEANLAALIGGADTANSAAQIDVESLLQEIKSEREKRVGAMLGYGSMPETFLHGISVHQSSGVRRLLPQAFDTITYDSKKIHPCINGAPVDVSAVPKASVPSSIHRDENGSYYIALCAGAVAKVGNNGQVKYKAIGQKTASYAVSYFFFLPDPTHAGGRYKGCATNADVLVAALKQSADYRASTRIINGLNEGGLVFQCAKNPSIFKYLSLLGKVVNDSDAALGVLEISLRNVNRSIFAKVTVGAPADTSNCGGNAFGGNSVLGGCSQTLAEKRASKQ